MKEAEEEKGNRRKGRGAEGELVGVVKKKAAEQVVDEVAAGRGTEGNSDRRLRGRCRGLDCGVSGAAIDASNFRLRKAMLEKPTKMFRYMAGRLLKLSLFTPSPPLQCRKNKRQIRRIKLATESKKNSWQREEERKEREEKRGRISVPPCATRVNVQVSSKRFALLLLLQRFRFLSFLRSALRITFAVSGSHAATPPPMRQPKTTKALLEQ